MTQNLQIILALLGAAAVLAIYWFSKRQQRTVRRAHRAAEYDADRADRAEEGDALRASKVAPRFGGRGAAADDGIPVLDDPIDDALPVDAVAAMEDADAVAEAAEDGMDTARGDADADAAQIDSPTAADEFDDAQPSAVERAADPPSAFRPRAVEGFRHLRQIDYWAKISGERDVGRESVLAIYREGAAELQMPHGLYGVKLPTNAWCAIEDEAEDSRFGNVMLTIQLASRDGVITQQDLSRFESLAMRLSVGTGRESSLMTSAANALDQGHALSEFIAHFDAVSLVRIHPSDGEPFDGAAIDRHARKIGLEPSHAGQYARFQSVGKERMAMYSLAEASESGAFDLDDMASHRAPGLVFFTHPARNRSPGAVFAEMANTAIAFAARIKGVVDLGTGAKPTHDDIEALRRPIDAAAAEMERLGIAAGSEEALRIF